MLDTVHDVYYYVHIENQQVHKTRIEKQYFILNTKGVRNTKRIRTKRYNPACHIIARTKRESVEKARRFMRKKAREHKRQTGQDLTYEIIAEN